MSLKQLFSAFVALTIAMVGTVSAGTVKIALDSPPDLEKSGAYVWLHTFSTYLNDHGLSAKEYQQGALGDEAERLDQISTGVLEISGADVASVGRMNPLIFGAILPYFIKDAAELDRALYKGGILAKINEGITGQGVRLLSINHTGLPAGLFNTKHPIHNAADMRDLRMRALDKLQLTVYKLWGSNATIVAWGEVPNALQTGIADGYVNPPHMPLLYGHTGFIKHFTDAGVGPSIRLTIASEDWYQNLSGKDRKIVDDGVATATRANREWLVKRAGILKELEEHGIKVVKLSPEARVEFRKLSDSLYKKGPLPPKYIKIWETAIKK